LPKRTARLSRAPDPLGDRSRCGLDHLSRPGPEVQADLGAQARPEATDKDQRFLDQAEIECKVAQALDHPAIRKIPRLIKKGSLLRTKELFLVMELVDGMSMERHPPATFETAVDIFHQVARGLHHMHDRGYVHADMKPNNIVVSDNNRAKVIDLGPVVQDRDDQAADPGHARLHRPRAGAPARDHAERTDVYNFGATMYWVMTRRRTSPPLWARATRSWARRTTT
jgi:serine/threonine protein kinase